MYKVLYEFHETFHPEMNRYFNMLIKQKQVIKFPEQSLLFYVSCICHQNKNNVFANFR